MSVVNRSSGLGSGYCSTERAWLIVTLYIVPTDSEMAILFGHREDGSCPVAVRNFLDDALFLKAI